MDTFKVRCVGYFGTLWMTLNEELQSSKLGFYVLFNSQGHIATDLQHLSLVGVELT